MLKSLTADQLARYERDGFVFPLRAMPPERARTYRGRLEASERAVGGPSAESTRKSRTGAVSAGQPSRRTAAEAVAGALTELRADGAYQKMFNAYGRKLYDDPFDVKGP